MNKDVLIPFKNEVFKLIRKIPEHSLSNELDLPFWENKLNSDVVLKRDGFLFFCERINEAVIIFESTKNNIKIYDSEKMEIEKDRNLFLEI